MIIYINNPHDDSVKNLRMCRVNDDDGTMKFFLYPKENFMPSSIKEWKEFLQEWEDEIEIYDEDMSYSVDDILHDMNEFEVTAARVRINHLKE